jgi:hypothetical protein
MPRKNTFLRDSSPAFLAIATFASLGAFTVGYDGGWWGLLIGAPYFNEMYGSYTTTTDGVASTALSATEQSLATSLPVIGTLIGIMVSTETPGAAGVPSWERSASILADLPGHPHFQRAIRPQGHLSSSSGGQPDRVRHPRLIDGGHKARRHGTRQGFH